MHIVAVIAITLGLLLDVPLAAQEVRPALAGEAAEDWVMLGTKLHGGFGSYIALGVYIGLDAREHLNAEPRTLRVSLINGAAAPCACVADGLQLSTGATPGRGLLAVDTTSTPTDVFGIVTLTHVKTGRALRYAIPVATRALLDGWNKLPPSERLAALRRVPAAQLFTRNELKP